MVCKALINMHSNSGGGGEGRRAVMSLAPWVVSYPPFDAIAEILV
jgi:hypothetical protein